MTVEQVYTLVNTITAEQLGDSVIVNEDLSNIVDIGRAFENANSLDNYVRSLNDHIGKMVFVNRVYNGRGASLVRDGWEYGSILEKVRAQLPEATENESWELQDGASYDPNVFYKPIVSVKFFNDRVTFEVPISITEKQVKSAFSSAVQMNSFVSMLYTAIANSLTVKLDGLIMRTINAMIGETLYSDYGASALSSKSGVRAINLLYLYNQTVAEGDRILTPSAAITDPAFLRFATLQIKDYVGRLQNMSTLFNVGGTEKFTSRDRMHMVFLDEFINATEVYLYDGLNQFRNENLRLPDGLERVSYWQGSGTGYAFDDITAINIVTPSGDTVNADGILGIVFDRDAMGVANLDRRVTTHYNPKAEFWNEWHKIDVGFWADLDENAVVFFVA